MGVASRQPRSKDDRGFLSLSSDTVTLTAVGPYWVSTKIEISPPSVLVRAHDTLTVSASMINPTRAINRIVWSVGTVGWTVRDTAYNSRTVRDDLRIVRFQSESLWVFLSCTNEAGTELRDSVRAAPNDRRSG